jgi:putative membrane protein
MIPFHFWLTGLPSFLAHFAAALILATVFLTIYLFVTPYRELALIRAGNSAAAASLSGVTLGYIVALASAIANSQNLLDMVIWGTIALIVQLLAFFIVKALLPSLASDIPDNKIGSGVFLGTVSLGLGLLNAACMTY